MLLLAREGSPRLLCGMGPRVTLVASMITQGRLRHVGCLGCSVTLGTSWVSALVTGLCDEPGALAAPAMFASSVEAMALVRSLGRCDWMPELTRGACGVAQLCCSRADGGRPRSCPRI